MTYLLQDLLNDYDAAFGVNSQIDTISSTSPQQNFSQQTPARSSFQSNQSQSFSQKKTPISATQDNIVTPSVNENRSFLYQNSPQNTSQNNYNNTSFVYDNSQDFKSPQTIQQQIQQQQQKTDIPVPKLNKISVEQATQIINDLKKERIKDAKKMQELQTENARLSAKITILEHTDLKVAELGSRVEQLLQKYLEAEQIRTQQAAQISQLRQEVIVLKSRLASNNSQMS